jgi:hypothetical protein
VTSPLPRPMIDDGVVVVDSAARQLVVRPAPAASGYTRLLWRRGVAALVEAEQLDRFGTGAPTVWASGGGQRQIAVGRPGERGELRFSFPAPNEIYSALVSAPLRARIAVDRATGTIMGVRFVNRGARGDVGGL